jgi:phosphinothricin acetyltransferase
VIRLATTEDAAAILEIYRPAVEDLPISFETVAPSLEEMQQRIISCFYRFPWVVEDVEGQLRGYAYANVYRPRAAYRWTVITSVFVTSELARQGIASRLYRVLFAVLERQGARQALAAITNSNVASQRFHEAHGFRKVGEMPNLGFKLGEWQSVAWWQRALGDGAASAPSEVIPLEKLTPTLPNDLAELLSESPEANT